jgi:antitoxin component YwqK of YwqJK toxin-antitoxin module
MYHNLIRSYIPFQQANNNKLLYIYLLLFICIVNSKYLLSQDSNYVELFSSSGILSSEGLLINNLPQGEWISYHSNGNLKSKGSWKNNKLIGTWSFYNFNGLLIKKEEYKNNLKDGFSCSYDSLGRLIKKTTFRKNEKSGKELIMFKNQKKIRFENNYSNNLKHDLNKEYDSIGNIISLIYYDMGMVTKREDINRFDRELKKHGVWKTFYKNGNLKSKQIFFHGNLNGASKTYNINGGINVVENYNKGGLKKVVKQDIKLSKTKNKEGFTIEGVINKKKKNGLFKVYDKNKKLFKQEFYKNDTLIFSGSVDSLNNKNGLWIYYYSKGDVKKKGFYKDNQKNGDWEFYYENNNLEQKGSYKNGKPAGIWVWWYENKQERRKEEYIRGKINGIVLEYDSIGNTITEGNYINGIREGEWKYQYNDFQEHGVFADGMKTGVWKAHYNNGNKLFIGEYLNDIPINEHKQFFPNGKIKEIGSYQRGEKEGEWRKYNNQGVVLITTEYRNGEEYKVDGIRLNKKQ